MTFLFLALDESIPLCCPKTSKLGGLPNYTNDPTKPVQLGAMLKNFSECNTGAIVCNEVFQNIEQQLRKKYSRGETSFPDVLTTLFHVTKVSRQVEGAGIERNGWVGGYGWVSGDAWVGSGSSCAELKKHVDASNTFVAKRNTNFPVTPSYRWLKARHGDRPSGH